MLGDENVQNYFLFDPDVGSGGLSAISLNGHTLTLNNGLLRTTNYNGFADIIGSGTIIVDGTVGLHSLILFAGDTTLLDENTIEQDSNYIQFGTLSSDSTNVDITSSGTYAFTAGAGISIIGPEKKLRQIEVRNR